MTLLILVLAALTANCWLFVRERRRANRAELLEKVVLEAYALEVNRNFELEQLIHRYRVGAMDKQIRGLAEKVQ